jgi:hypothetical protein
MLLHLRALGSTLTEPCNLTVWIDLGTDITPPPPIVSLILLLLLLHFKFLNATCAQTEGTLLPQRPCLTLKKVHEQAPSTLGQKCNLAKKAYSRAKQLNGSQGHACKCSCSQYHLKVRFPLVLFTSSCRC